jgi:hypothetical protein
MAPKQRGDPYRSGCGDLVAFSAPVHRRYDARGGTWWAGDRP